MLPPVLTMIDAMTTLIMCTNLNHILIYSSQLILFSKIYRQCYLIKKAKQTTSFEDFIQLK